MLISFRFATSITPTLSLPSSADRQPLPPEIDREMVDPAVLRDRAKFGLQLQRDGRCLRHASRRTDRYQKCECQRPGAGTLGDVDLRQRRLQARASFTASSLAQKCMK